MHSGTSEERCITHLHINISECMGLITKCVKIIIPKASMGVNDESGIGCRGLVR